MRLRRVGPAYPVLGKGQGKISPFQAKMAMAVRSKSAHWKMRDILRRHWVALGTRHGILDEAGRGAEQLIDAIAARTLDVIANVPHSTAREVPWLAG